MLRTRPAAPRAGAPPGRRGLAGGARVGLVVALGSVLIPLYGALRLGRDPFEDDLRTLRSRSHRRRSWATQISTALIWHAGC